MALPTYAEVLTQINTYIVANGNNEITANVLNPILDAILDFANNNIGDLDTLTTDEKNSIVEAINSLKQNFDDLVNNGVQLYTGIDNPNVTPPPTYNYADFYMQLDVDSLPVKLWQWNGFEWTDESGEPATESDNVINNSGVTGVTVTDALNNIQTEIDGLVIPSSTDYITNDSSVSGATATDALNNLSEEIAGIVVPDATTTVKGIVKLAGDLGGTADLPTTPTAVHLAGTETITGDKTFTGTVIVQAPTASTHAVTKAYADGLVVGLLDDRGSYNASTNLFPSTGGSGTAGAILKGDLWYVSVAGTLGGKAVAIGDSFRALVDAPGQTAGNWSVLSSNLGYVPANDANVIHTTGNESKTGTLGFTQTTGTAANIGLLNSSTDANSYSMNAGTVGNGRALLLQSGSNGTAAEIINAATGKGLYVVNQNTGTGIDINNAGTGNALNIFNSGTSTGVIKLNNTNAATPSLVLQSSGTNTFTVSRAGDIVANNYTGGAALTGTPTAPTAATGTSTTQIATTAFVQTAFNVPVSSSVVGIVNNTSLQELGGADKTINSVRIGSGRPFGANQNNLLYGYSPLTALTSGSFNIGIGYAPLSALTTGSSNIAISTSALANLTTGFGNIGIGQNAGSKISGGVVNNTTSGNSIFIGFETKPLANGGLEETVIGYGAVGAGNYSTTIGGASNTKTILTGNVGMGTTSPGEKLEVNGFIKSNRGADGAIIFGSTGGVNIYGDNSNILNFSTNGTEKMRINASGNVGIGTTTPANKLSLGGARTMEFDTSNGDFRIKGPAGGWSIGSGFTGLSGTNYDGFRAFGSSDSLIYYYIGGAYNLPYLAVNNSSGNVLIGTPTDDGLNKLQVNGTISATGIAAFQGSGAGGTNPDTFFNATPLASRRIDISFSPSGMLSEWFSIDTTRLATGSNYGVQFAASMESGRIFTRYISGGAWSAWVEK